MSSIYAYLSLREPSLDKNSSNEKVVSVFQSLLTEAFPESKIEQNKWKIDSSGIRYVAYESIINKSSLLEYIENNPEGLLVDEDLLKFTVDNISESIK